MLKRKYNFFPLLLPQQQRRVSAYMKLFGDEVKFAEMKNENVDQLANDVADLLLGKKDKIEYPGYGKN